jgi:hypothetical protein
MNKILLLGAFASSVLAASAIGACSSSDGGPTITPGGSSGSSSSGGSGSGSSSGSSSSSSSSSGGSSGSSSGSSSGDAGNGTYGVACTNPINNPGSGGSGGGNGGGSSGSNVDGGGVDPACQGEYDLCASIGGANICTKSCTYTGTSGPEADPTDCPNPPTNGECTPRSFCQ